MMMIILILTSLWWSSWSSPAWSPLSSSWFRCYMSTGQTAGLLWVWRWSLIFPSVEALREPALNTLVLFPPNNLCNFGVSSVFFVVHDFGLKEKFLERQIFLIRIFLIWQNPIVFPLLEFSLQSFGHKTDLFPIGGSVVQVTFYQCHHSWSGAYGWS